ncbi:MAG: SH3 domain-containing protein [Anaerolineaceae bacterium]|nr:SH3 domain-containing protein [Anaerolineaceae bacterium]
MPEADPFEVPTPNPGEANHHGLSDQGIGSLWNDLYGDVQVFSMDRLETLREPEQYPRFDLARLHLSPSRPDAQSPALPGISTRFASSIPTGSAMTTIRVDPPILQNCSQDVSASARTLTSIGVNLNSCANGAPSYDGQFGPKVRAIASEATSNAGLLSGVMSHLSGWLGTKVQQFLDADNDFSSSLTSAYSLLGWASGLIAFISSSITIAFATLISRWFPKDFNLWTTIPGHWTVPSSSTAIPDVYSATTTANLRLRSVAGLGGTVLGTLPLGTSLEVIDEEVSKDGYTWVKVRTADGRVGWVASRYMSRENAKDVAPKQSKTMDRVESISQRNILHIDQNFFTTVPTDGPDNNYWRLGCKSAGYPKSDCTWYAAEAVKKVSNEKVDLSKINSLGYAYEWAENADNYATKHPGGIIRSVNKDPEIGDVMCLRSGSGEDVKGHVAFVEHVVDNNDGSYTLIISEESADGKIPNWAVEKNKNDITPDSRNLRWRKSITISPNSSGNVSVDFIHFNY